MWKLINEYLTMRTLVHIPVGIFTAYCGYVGWVYGLIFFGGFMLYEVNQDWRLKDGAYLDIFGWLVGLAIAVIGIHIGQILEIV